MPATYLMPTYNRQPISFTRGSGSWLYTKDDTPYLDALTGIAVCGLGHCHPQVTDAIQQQAATLVHTSNLFGIDWQERAGGSYVLLLKWTASSLPTAALKQMKLP